MGEEANDNKPKKPFLKRLIKWGIILLLIIIISAIIGFKYSLVSVDQFKNWLGEIKVAESNDELKQPGLATISDLPPAATPTTTVIIGDVPPEGQSPVAETPPPAPEVNNSDIAVLKENQKYFALYLAARDMRDARNRPEKFADEYRYFTVMAGDNPEIAGKVDILRLSVETGIVTPAKLRDDLEVLVQSIEKETERGFWESIKFALGNLIRVTKVQGEDGNATPYEIKLRAQNYLNDGDLTAAIREVQKLGPRADDWVKEANNLARVYEITDFLVDYSRNKIKF